MNTFGNLVAQLIRNTCSDHADAYLFIGLTGMAIFGVVLMALLPKAQPKEKADDFELELEKEAKGGPFDVRNREG